MHNVGAIFAAVTLVTALQLPSCSKNITSLDSKKTLSSLSSDERRQYCEDRFHYINARVSRDDRTKVRCARAPELFESGGRSTARSRDTCKEVYQTCLREPAPEPPSACDAFARRAAECSVTVGEADECTEGQVDALEKLASMADNSCNNVGRRLSSREQAPETPAVCSKIQRICPNLLNEPLLREEKF